MSKFIFKIKNLKYSSSEGKIENFNLNLERKEIHAVIVKSSSDQRNLIEALLNYHKNQNVNGDITFKGERVSGNLFDKKNKLVLLHQKPLLINNFSVAENLSLTNMPTMSFLPFIHWGKLKKRAKGILEKLDFNINVKTKVSKLSLEEKRIVNISGAFLKNPEIIVMHEPMEGLSVNNALKLNKIIKQFKEEGGSIIYITKQWEEALKVSDHISIYNKGKIAGEMPAEMAKEDPQKLIKLLEDYNYKGNNKETENEIKNVLDAVFKAAEFLTSEYELKDVLLLLANEVTKVMHADGGAINLIDETTWTVIDNFEINNKNETQVRLKKDAIIKIAKQNDIYYVNQNDREFYSLFESISNVKTFICIPVLVRSQVSGIIQIFYDDYYVYSRDEKKYLSAFARHAAIAIEGTRLLGRSALLQESHHRIKNNLQSIVGLVTLQKNFVHKNPDQSIDDTLDNIIYRVKSIAAVHDLLSKDKLGRSIINVKDIVEAIIKFNNIDPNITINLELDNLFIPYSKAASIALIINELVINCYKYAFSEQEEGLINIHCKRTDKLIYLSVKDNGIGLPRNFDVNKLNSLGLSIIQAIVTNEFKGNLTFRSEEGTCVEITFPADRIFINVS